MRKIVLVSAVLIAAAAAAQTDRISGKRESDGQTLLDLKFDGDVTVIGTRTSASEIHSNSSLPNRVERCARTGWLRRLDSPPDSPRSQ